MAAQATLSRLNVWPCVSGGVYLFSNSIGDAGPTFEMREGQFGERTEKYFQHCLDLYPRKIYTSLTPKLGGESSIAIRRAQRGSSTLSGAAARLVYMRPVLHAVISVTLRAPPLHPHPPVKLCNMCSQGSTYAE